MNDSMSITIGNAETLYCEVGKHAWTRERARGRKPTTCPEHRAAPGESSERKPARETVSSTLVAQAKSIRNELPEDDRRPVDYMVEQLESQRREPSDIAMFTERLKQIISSHERRSRQ